MYNSIIWRMKYTVWVLSIAQKIEITCQQKKLCLLLHLQLTREVVFEYQEMYMDTSFVNVKKVKLNSV